MVVMPVAPSVAPTPAPAAPLILRPLVTPVMSTGFPPMPIGIPVIPGSPTMSSVPSEIGAESEIHSEVDIDEMLSSESSSVISETDSDDSGLWEEAAAQANAAVPRAGSEPDEFVLVYESSD